MRVPDGRAGGSGAALDGAVGPRRSDTRTRPASPACGGSVHDPRSGQPRGPRSVSTISGIWHGLVAASTEKKRIAKYERIWRRLGSRSIEDLIELP